MKRIFNLSDRTSEKFNLKAERMVRSRIIEALICLWLSGEIDITDQYAKISSHILKEKRAWAKLARSKRGIYK